MGAFDRYDDWQKQQQAPASSGGAFANYPSTQGAPAPPSPGAAPQQGAPAPPAAQGLGDYLLQHLARTGTIAPEDLAPAGSGYDFVRAAANTFGLGDRALAHAQTYGVLPTLFPSLAPMQTGGPDYQTNLAAERAKTAQAEGRLDLPTRMVANAVGYAPLGAVGVARRVGGAVAPAVGRYVGGLIGSGAEGLAATAAGQAGRGEAITPQSLGLGTALGVVGGIPGGVVGRGGAPGASETAKSLSQMEKDAYAPLDNMFFMQNEVKPQLDTVKSGIDSQDLTGSQWRLAKSTKAEFDNLVASPQLTGTDLQKAQARLNKTAYSPTASDQDKRFAPTISDALQTIMETGISPTAQTGAAAEAKRIGDVLHGFKKDTERLNTWATKSNVAGGPDVASQARDFLLTKEGQKYAAPGTPQYDTLNRLAGTVTPSPWSPTTWDVKHHLMWPVAGLLAGQGIGALATAETGGQHPWYAMPAEDLAGLGAGLALRGTSAGLRNQAIQRAVQAARPALSTGVAQAPVLPAAPFREAVRRLIYGEGAAGAY